MATYNIFTYKNGEIGDEPSIVVELSENDAEIVSVTSSDPEQQEEDEKSLRHYVELGATPLGAIKRYAGPYDQIWNADGSGQVEETAEEAPEPEVEAEEEAVVSATEDASVEEVSPQASRITSGAVMALVSDAGVVVTLSQADDEGTLNYRMNGEWKPITDPEAISELNFVGVEEEALNLYDEHQGNGNLVPIQYYPASVEGPFWTDIIVTDGEDAGAPEAEETTEADEDDEEAVTAAITLNGPRDLDNAISAALLNKDLRWFVSRRVKALGLEADLPWEDQ